MILQRFFESLQANNRDVISKNNTLRPVRPVRLTPGTSEC